MIWVISARTIVGSMPSFVAISASSFLASFCFGVSWLEYKYSLKKRVSRTSFKLVFFSEFIDHFVNLLNCCVSCIDAYHIQDVGDRFE